ncbi:MAG: complex I subunit 1 family protein [Akkermansia sp.]
MIDTTLQFLDNLFANPIWFYLITLIIKIVICLAITIAFVPISVLVERRVASFIQDRVGPNRAGIPLSIFRRFGSKADIPLQSLLDQWGLPHDGKVASLFKFLRMDKDIPILGLVQPAVDGAKLFLKQDFTPPFVRKCYFWIAPALVLAAPLMTVAAIPFGGTLETPYGNVNMVVANLNIGPLWIFAISSISVYGLVLAGWASNSKYPLLGGIRSSAQMISYEISMGLSIIPLLMIYSTLNLQDIVQYQADNGWLLLPFWGEGLSMQRWVLLIPIAISFVIFLSSVFAETNRTPFDMSECETDLVGGYHTEYSSMKFALFFMGEYAAMVVGSAFVVTLFLGGWSMGFGLDGLVTDLIGNWAAVILQIIAFVLKLFFFVFFFVWVRWTLPRFRYDQVMKLGWLVFFEAALVNIFITAAILYFIK